MAPGLLYRELWRDLELIANLCRPHVLVGLTSLPRNRPDPGVDFQSGLNSVLVVTSSAHLSPPQAIFSLPGAAAAAAAALCGGPGLPREPRGAFRAHRRARSQTGSTAALRSCRQNTRVGLNSEGEGARVPRRVVSALVSRIWRRQKSRNSSIPPQCFHLWLDLQRRSCGQD